MPTYEYRCNACENEFELEKRMSDPVEAACPACGSDRTNRLISHSSFVLKGSGWYLTDYARKNGKGTGGENRPRHEGDAKKDAPGVPAPAASESSGSSSQASKAGDTPASPPATAATAPASTAATGTPPSA